MVGGSLSKSFLDGLHPEARARLETQPVAVTRALDTYWNEARAEWPGITVASERFASELGRRLGREASLDSLARTCAKDVYLAIACADGDRAAIQRFEQVVLREVDSAGAKLRATPDQTEEVSRYRSNDRSRDGGAWGLANRASVGLDGQTLLVGKQLFLGLQ